MSVAGLNAYHVIGLPPASVAVVGLFSSDTSHDIVLVHLAIALIWSLEPKFVPLSPIMRRVMAPSSRWATLNVVPRVVATKLRERESPIDYLANNQGGEDFAGQFDPTARS